MQSGAVEASRKLHEVNPTYSLPSAYSDKGKLKGKLELPLALKKTHLIHPVTRFLDYGCGQNGLVNLLRKYDGFESIEFNSFDPAIKKYSENPCGEFDILTCIDVLEHISRGQITYILDNISNLTRGFFFFAIDLVPAFKTLSDKRNAHILLAPPDWWCQQISSKFSCTRFLQVGNFESGEVFPCHLFGWATNSPGSQQMANVFFDSIEIFSKKWILHSEDFHIVKFQSEKLQSS